MILGKDAIIIDIEDAIKISAELGRHYSVEVLKDRERRGVFDAIERLGDAVRSLESDM